MKLKRADLKELRALTVHNPWAWAIAEGHKQVENRSTAPPRTVMGKWLAIHAGQAWNAESNDVLLEKYGIDAPSEAWESAIVAVVRVVGYISPGGLTCPPEVLHLSGPVRRWWLKDSFGWLLVDTWKVPEPVGVSGQQSVWVVPPDVLADLLAQVPE